MIAEKRHRFDGLEPDNLLSFLSLLGLLRAIEATDRTGPNSDNIFPRLAWDLDKPPIRPILCLSKPIGRDELTKTIANGLSVLARDHDFQGRKDLNYSKSDARDFLRQTLDTANHFEHGYADLAAALLSDAAIKSNKKEEIIDPTPLCLLFGQGHQHFLDRLASIPKEDTPPPRGRGKQAKSISASECLSEALYQPWHRDDPTFSLRWDPEEDVRYALMAGNPTDAAYKSGTQHGANRLAAVGLAALTMAPQIRGGQVRPSVIGGKVGRRGGFSLAWPVWRDPASLASIRALLGHPKLREFNALSHLSVDHVLIARRISVGKFMNFTRARILEKDS